MRISDWSSDVCSSDLTEPKRVRSDVMQQLKGLTWPGNVRQLENVCRWLTVMAPGQDVHPQDLPPELTQEISLNRATVSAPTMSVAGAASVEVAEVVAAPRATAAGNWSESLQQWAREALAAGHDDLLGTAMPLFERTMLDVALQAPPGQRPEAARRLGWGDRKSTRLNSSH